MFESVPSVEYKRLDETEKSQNDSLDDISVSLNNDPIRSQVASMDNDKERPEDQALSFIDEEPNVILEAGGNLSSLDTCEGSPPSSGLIRDTGNGNLGHVAVCDDCVHAGHLDNGGMTAETPAEVTKETVSDINQNIQIEKHQETKDEATLDNVLKLEVTTTEPKIGAKTDIEPGEGGTAPVTDTGHQMERKEEETKPEENGLMSAQQPLMSSKLSVASIQSGESLGSFSFSADSLGKLRI